MKIYKTVYVIMMWLGISYSSIALASEQVFEINNSLAKIDVEGVTDSYLDIFNHLTNDIKNDGIRFSYAGTRVTNDSNNTYLNIENIQIFLKKEIFEKYQKHSEIYFKETLFNEAQKKFGTYYIFSTDSSKYYYPKLQLRMEILDSNNKAIWIGNLKTTFGVDGMGVSYNGFFKYINEINNTNKQFEDIDIRDRFRHNISIPLSIQDIQRISSIKFSVIDNPY